MLLAPARKVMALWAMVPPVMVPQVTVPQVTVPQVMVPQVMDLQVMEQLAILLALNHLIDNFISLETRT
jgi:hypothetical protein